MIGVLIGGAIGLLGATIPLVWAIRYDEFRDAKTRHLNYLAWIRGLRDEAAYLISCAGEIESGMTWTDQPPRVTLSTKRLNADFLCAARAEVIHHERSPAVFPLVTRAYRDAEHTNGMLDSLSEEAKAGYNPSLKRGGPPVSFQSAQQSVVGVRATLMELEKLCDEQQQIEHPPKLWCYLLPKA